MLHGQCKRIKIPFNANKWSNIGLSNKKGWVRALYKVISKSHLNKYIYVLKYQAKQILKNKEPIVKNTTNIIHRKYSK